jgi:hypothetical protein
MDMSRLPRQAYQMLLNIDDKGKKCWVTTVKNTLFSLGFGYVWLNQGVGCEVSFIALFKQRLLDNFLQEWYSSVMVKDLYSTYRLFKTELKSEQYFDFLDIRCFRDCLVKLRLGVLPINGSFFRTTHCENANNSCTNCNEKENEYHFVHTCPLYDDLRDKYLISCYQPYTVVLKNGNVDRVRKLSMYVFYALQRRQEFINTFDNCSFVATEY